MQIDFNETIDRDDVEIEIMVEATGTEFEHADRSVGIMADSWLDADLTATDNDGNTVTLTDSERRRFLDKAIEKLNDAEVCCC